LFWVISSTTGDLHLAANQDDEAIIALAARLVPKKITTKFAMFMVNKRIYNLHFKVSMHKENEKVVGFVKVIGNGA
jgi:hypothetical protein